MTVKELKKMIANAPDDALVYLENPHMFKNAQKAHELAGVRYSICDGDYFWFERYCDENIADEVEAIANVAIEEGWGDEEYVMEVLGKEGHGYTLEDIKKNCNKDVYEFIVKAAREHGMI